VAEHSDFDTFLLTDPPRLIIDIHGKHIQGRSIQGQETEGKNSYTNNTQNSDVPPRNAQGKAIRGRQPTIASLKEPETARPEVLKTVDAAVPAQPKTAARTRQGGGTARKTVVDADDGDDDTAVTVAKLDPPEIKPTVKAADVPNLPPLSKTSARSKRPSAATVPDVREASPTAKGDRSLIRALGLKIGKIVIDPGHGGHDTGSIGPNGLEEKDLVLDVGRRLGKLLQARLGADVVFTRKDDTFIPLETRTSIANQEQADLFVSIHANSSRDSDARGVETYYLNFTSSAEALDVAARENAASDKSIHELQDLVKKIALKEKIEESREFASNVQRALHSGLSAKNPGIRDRGVKKAPFVVLIGANMPSILAEISFVSNPGDERRLTTPEYRQRIAESLYRGISKYVSGLSGVKVASKMSKTEAQ
jgi:N-acetylmuramoyl-L-alanine amidase